MVQSVVGLPELSLPQKTLTPRHLSLFQHFSKNTDHYSVHEATETDLPRLANLFSYANPHATTEEIFRWTRKTADLPFYERVILSVKTPEGKVVGGTASWLKREENKPPLVILDDFALEPIARGSGLATALWEEVVIWAKQRKAKKIRLEVHYQCNDAIPRYYHWGARIVTFKKDHFGFGQDAMILEVRV